MADAKDNPATKAKTYGKLPTLGAAALRRAPQISSAIAASVMPTDPNKCCNTAVYHVAEDRRGAVKIAKRGIVIFRPFQYLLWNGLNGGR